MMLHLSEGFLYITSHSLFLPATTTRYRFCIIIFIPYNKTRAGVPASIKNIQTFRLTNFDETRKGNQKRIFLTRKSLQEHEHHVRSRLDVVESTTDDDSDDDDSDDGREYEYKRRSSYEYSKFHESNLLHQPPKQPPKRKRQSHRR